MKKVFSLVLALLLIVSSLALPAMAAGKAKTKITLNKKGTVTLNIGDKLQLKATVTPEAKVTWKSSKNSVASVNETGLVTPHKAGNAKITAKAGGKTAKVTIKVVDPFKPTKLAINQGKKANLDINKTLALTTTLTPANAKSELTYKSSKKKVATVDKNGVVTPLKEGKTKITVTAKSNKKAKATITITVKDPYKPTKLTIKQGKNATLAVGETLSLTTTLTPATAKTECTYKSSKKSVATVDANGVIKAVKKGTAKITVTSKTNKKAKATITIKVNAAPKMTFKADLTGFIGQNAKAVKDGLKLKVNTSDYKSIALVGDGFILFADGNGSNLAKLFISGAELSKANGHNILGCSVGMKYTNANAKLVSAGWRRNDIDIKTSEYDGSTEVPYEKEDKKGYRRINLTYGKNGKITDVWYWSFSGIGE